MLPGELIRSPCSLSKRRQWSPPILSCCQWCKVSMKGRNMDIDLCQNQHLRKSYWHSVQRLLTSLPRKKSELRREKLQSGPPVSRVRGPDREQSTDQSRRLPTCLEKGLNFLLSVSPEWRNMSLRIRIRDRFALLPPRRLCHHLGFTPQTCLVGLRLLLKTLT